MEISYMILSISFFGLVVCMLSSDRLNASINRKLRRKIKKSKRSSNGGREMSKIITDIVGHKCCIYSNESISQRIGIVNSADEEWINFTYKKKDKTITSIIRVDSIRSIDLVE